MIRLRYRLEFAIVHAILVANRKNRMVCTPASSNRATAVRLLPALAAVLAVAGCTQNHPPVQLPPPPGPTLYWYVHDSSEKDGKITFRCIDGASMACADQTDRWIMLLQAAKMCRDWGYEGLNNGGGPNIAWTRPTREGLTVAHQATFRCRKPKKK